MSIRRRGKQSYEVRVRPFASRYAPTREAAEKLELDLKLKRSMGDLYESPAITLLQAIDEHIDRRKALGGRRGKLRPRSIEFIERSLHLWKTNMKLAATKLPNLRRADVEDALAARHTTPALCKERARSPEGRPQGCPSPRPTS